MNFEKQIRSYLVDVRKDVTKQINALQMSASGRMEHKFRVVANQHLVGEIRGVHYMKYLENTFTGRPQTVGRQFVENIIEWFRYKRLQPKRNGEIIPSTETNIKRSAFGIAKSIVANGTKYSKSGVGLDIQGAMNRHKSDYLESIGKEFLKEFSENLKIK